MATTRAVILASIICLLTAHPGAAEWRRLDSPNFIVIGDVSARELREVAVKFEGFRETLQRVLSESATTAAVPTVVIVFPSDKAFTPFKPIYQGKPREDVRGLFVGGQNVNYIAMESTAEISERVIFHEYAHLVISNAMSNVPIWLNEGLAEYYSTFHLMQDGRRAQLGLPIEDHLRLLNSGGRISIPELLKVDTRSPLYNEGARASVFYAESWVLTHLILNGEPSRINELGAYLRSVRQGVPEDRAWEEAFGTSRMDQEFRRYLTRRVFNTAVFDFPDKVVTLSATAAPISQTDATTFLAGFLAQQRKFDAAAAQLAPALKNDPANPRVNVVMAEIEIGRQEHASAEKRLLALGKIDDWFVAYTVGIALADLSEGTGGPSETPGAEAAKRMLESVRRDRGDLPNVLARLAMLELQRGAEPSADARASIARARALVPGRADYTLVQAEVLARGGDFVGARNTIGPLMTTVYPPEVRNSARRLMGYVVDLENNLRRASASADRPAAPAGDLAARPTPASKTVPVPGTGSDAARADNGPGVFIPAFRRLESGERRLDGTLERIDCPPAGPAMFHVRSTDGISQLEAGRLADVQFISYRNDLRGNVSCGPLKDPIHVYVTWREGSPLGREIVVAIEFLPK
jgi:hypothetical protein